MEELNMNQTELIGIGEVSEILGISEKILRSWDDSKLKSVRTEGGHRRYDKKEVLLLKNKVDPKVEEYNSFALRLNEEITYCRHVHKDRIEHLPDNEKDVIAVLLENQRLLFEKKLKKDDISELEFIYDVVISFWDKFVGKYAVNVIPMLSVVDGAYYLKSWSPPKEIVKNLTQCVNVIKNRKYDFNIITLNSDESKKYSVQNKFLVEMTASAMADSYNREIFNDVSEYAYDSNCSLAEFLTGKKHDDIVPTAIFASTDLDKVFELENSGFLSHNITKLGGVINHLDLTKEVCKVKFDENHWVPLYLTPHVHGILSVFNDSKRYYTYTGWQLSLYLLVSVMGKDDHMSFGKKFISQYNKRRIPGTEEDFDDLVYGVWDTFARKIR